MSKFRKIAGTTVILAGFAWAVALAFTSHQLLSFTNANGDTTDFACSSTCPSNSTQLLSKGDFVSYYLNNGNCASGKASNYIMSYSDELACAVTTSTIDPTTDPWLTGGNVSWPNDTGTAVFVFSPLPSGAASGAQSVTTNTDGSITIKQQLSPNPITSGTTIHVSAQLYSEGNSVTVPDSTCGGTTGYSSSSTATVNIVRGDGTVMAATDLADGANTWEVVTASTTSNSSTNYYAKVTVAHDTTAFTNYTGSPGFCSSFSDSVSSQSYGTDITAGN